MLYVVEDITDNTAWYPNYLSGLKRGLDNNKVDYVFTSVVPQGVNDPVLLTRYTLFELVMNSANPPKNIFIQEHDVWNPFTVDMNPESLSFYHHPDLKGILFTHPSMIEWGQRCLKPNSGVTITAGGFPYNHDFINERIKNIKPANEREKLIVFPGRLNEFYQPYLSVRLGIELVERGYRVVIASPINPMDYYPVDIWREIGFEVGRYSQPDFYTLLSEATAAISMTIGGSLTLSLYEAHLLGAKAILPKGKVGYAPFTEMFTPRFDLLNPREALEILDNDVKIDIDTKWFSEQYYTETLLNLIEIKNRT
ncbi:hypothetical protein SAMN04487897_11015 [Paenibacillus sp. yr247]|nr:hypothetical protein SAMN04487897_11015 [Paenibacillus sp. yr247]